MSQFNNFSKNSFTPKQFKTDKPKNEQNQFIYDKFIQMRDSAAKHNNKGALFCYIKIIKSMEKYPLPIMNGK
jgi:hypothetical protein